MAGTQSTYLDQYLDNLESLSPELTRNFKIIHDLDVKVQDILIEIDTMKADYLTNFKSWDNEAKANKMKVINKKYEKCKQLSDEKVQLANQTYELVDKHIRKLDLDLTNFEAELKEKLAQRRSGELTDNLHFAEAIAPSLHNVSVGASVADKKKKKKTEHPTLIMEETAAALPISSLALTLAQPADVLDMPVDPNEPTYCLCHQVSYGEMIGCDNPDCAIEWFHFGCVNLTNKPKGKWYCPVCAEKRKAKA